MEKPRIYYKLYNGAWILKLSGKFEGPLTWEKAKDALKQWGQKPEMRIVRVVEEIIEPPYEDEPALALAAENERLREVCQMLIAYRDAAGPLNFQLEKADDFINLLRSIIAKVSG